ncbi:MAG TPA: lasso peptide biosynthesis B2 protein [Conexibacter sp.]|nr:lasso peptide biosynthesis B2 protein [Conexibacter sp.]
MDRATRAARSWNPPSSRLRALGELSSAREGLLLAQLGAFAATVPLLMRLPLPRLAALLTRPPRHAPASPGEVERLERLIALAPRVAQPLVRTGCLTRGVTLYWFLRRAGLDVELHFGLDPGHDAATDGHCWLSLDGEPFLEQRDPRPRFVELYRLSRAVP